ncbi:MAG: TonB-dependent receptor [Flaviaesturariibacter sp.]|nr:TonB-dependent receptor [Flaviaesturariibacter sp.]
MKRILIVAAFLCGVLQSFAQTTLRGRIFDASTNLPLAGATVTFGGTTFSADKEGNFSVDCSKASRLTVSHVGYATYQQTIRNCNEALSIALSALNETLSDVEITATSAQSRSMLSQPVSITRLGTQELRRGTGLFLDDAINANVPGVTMNRRAVSSGQQFNIRGYGNGVRGTNGASSNFDAQGTKVYLNGIPITDAEGITVLDDIDFNSIGTVEVTKGPAGTLYGLAIAGVVNLKTIKPESGKTSVGQDVLFGSNGLERYTTHFTTATARSSLLVNYGHQEYSGFMVHTASHKDFVNFAGDFTANAKQSLNTYFGYSHSYDQRAGELTLGQYDTLNYSGNATYIKNNAHSEVTSFRAGVTHNYQFSNRFSNATTLFGSGVNNNASSAGGWTDKQPVNFGLRSTFLSRLALGMNTLSGITGIETAHQRAQTIGYAMGADSGNLAGYNRILAERSNQATITATTSVFTEWTLALPSDFSVTAGVGVSNMKIVLDDRFFLAANNRPNNVVPTHFGKKYNSMVSPHVAINKIFDKQFSVYASYSKGYKAPVSSYFYIPYVSGAPASAKINPVLRPEIGEQFEIGTKGKTVNGRLNFELALFKAVFSHKMTNVAVPLDANTTAYNYIVNGGKQDHTGVELALKFAAYQSSLGFFKTVSPFVNIAYSDFKYDNFQFKRLVSGLVVTDDYSGKAVAGVSPLTATVGIDVATNPGFYLNSYYSYRDAMPIVSTGQFKTKAYSLVNAKLGFRRSVSTHVDLDLFGGATNLAGTQYPGMVFINQLPDAYVPAPLKAQFFGGINFSYNF